MSTDVFGPIHQAAEIATSGRRDFMNARIRDLSANPHPDNNWWVHLIGSLCSQVFSEYNSLKGAYENKQAEDVPLLAWRARNLLELAVWSKYCTKDRANARRFFEDAGRDTHEIYDKLLDFGNAGLFTGETPTDWSTPFEKAKRDLDTRARAEGIESLDGRYTSAGAAAKACGIGEQFILMNKILSKFAHPTALWIMAPPVEKCDEFPRTYYFRYGCWFFISAVQDLECQLRTKDANSGLAEETDLRSIAAET